MAVTAAITVSTATCRSEQTVAATCTVTNSGTGAIGVLSVVPVVTPHSATPQSVAVATGNPMVGGGFAFSVPGSSGTLAVTFSVTPHAPVSSYGLSEPASLVYDVGATVNMADGSVVTASTTTLTVTSAAN